jgi:uncharacterized protein
MINQSQLNHPIQHENISLHSLGDRLVGTFISNQQPTPHPVLIIAHGAGEHKENYFEMAAHLAAHGIATLALDMHGHGASEGRAHHVRMAEWVADLRAALDYLEKRPDIDSARIAACGLSSGGTAILETAAIDPRFKALIALDATVMDTLPWHVSLTIRSLSLLGSIKELLTGKGLHLNLLGMLKDLELAHDPEINARLKKDPGKLRAFSAFPLPGAKEAFVIDTIKRVHQIKAPTLIVWGENDKLDDVSTAHTLHAALRCEKKLSIIPQSGHVVHLDQQRFQMFELAAEWLKTHL